MGELSDRRLQTADRIKDLQIKLSQETTDLSIKGSACVYATGSFGRCEASLYSDLDLFILGKTGDTGKQSHLRHLDEICLKAVLIDVARKSQIPEFSGDGQYLTHYSVKDLTSTLGTPNDDVTNTFTARLLFLLESKPLLGEEVYRDVIEEVIAAYWIDYEDHKRDFMPAFLANDIIRLWRTFCVNYEARTRNIPEDQKAKRRVKNYKLKHSRLLTCYSALLHMLFTYEQNKTVSPHDVVDMASMTPTERLEWLLDQRSLQHARETINRLLEQYERFLKTTNDDEEKLLARFLDKGKSAAYMEEASTFGDLVFAALKSIGRESRFYRLLVV